MYTHRIQIFNRAYDDAVVRLIAHHLHLEFFPAQQRFFDQQLTGGRCLQATLANCLELFGVVSNTASGSTQRKARSNDSRKAQGLLHRPSLFHAVGDVGTGRAQANLCHRMFELQAILGFIDGLWAGTY